MIRLALVLFLVVVFVAVAYLALRELWDRR